MKVWLDKPAHANSGGMYRVFHGLYTYLPELGIEITNSKNEADVLNPHIGLFSSFPLGTPLVVSSHGMLWQEHKWGSMADKVNRECLNAYRRADVVTAPSKFTANAIARYTGASPIVVRHGIDTDQWQPNNSTGDYVIWNKTRPDAANLPTEMNTLASLVPDTMFYATHGKEANNVYIFGRVAPEDMLDLVAHASVYLDTSKESGGPCFGVLEAMACAVPTLSWDFGGTSEAVVHKETGYLAEPYNYDDLIEGLHYCIKHKERLGLNARQMVVEKYQWTTVIEGYATAYQQALDGVSECSVSIIIPCYNLEEFLPHCLDSLIQQTYQNWEAIVVDDASPGNAWDITNHYSLNVDSRIIGVKLPVNHHVSDARNIGIDESVGNYILPLDADDRLFPTALETMVNELDADRALDIVAGKLRVYHESDLEGKSIDSGWPNNAELKLQLEGFNRLPYSSMYRRKVWERTGGYRRRIRSGVEDADFWTRAMSYGYNAKIVDDYTLKYTKRVEGLGNTNTKGTAAWLPWFPWDSLTAPATATQVKNFDPPSVSVIIPVGPGHTKHIQACIDSLVAQTEDNWEAIVINDTGKRWFEDGKPLTYQVLGMGFVRFIDSEVNSGVGYARNRGIEAARSGKIVFLDADDVAQPHLLQALLIAQEKVGGWIYGDWYVNVGKGSLEYSEAPDWDYRKILNRSLAPITGIYEKAHLLLVEGFDEELAGWEDWDMQLKLLHHGICGTRLKTPLITYNMHLGWRREENFSKHKDLVQCINDRHSILRSKKMGCKSCGGGKTLIIKQKSSTTSEDNMEDVVYLKFLGTNLGRKRERSKTHPSTHYSYSSNRPVFGVFKSDVAYYLSLKFPGTNLDMYEPVQQAKHQPQEVEIAAEPLVSDDVPHQEVTKPPILVEDLALDSRIIRMLVDNGFNDVHQIDDAPDADLLAIKGVGESRVAEIRQAVREWYLSTW